MSREAPHLEGNGVVILAGVDLLGDTAVGAICTHHCVHLDGLRLAHLTALLVAVEVDRVAALGPLLRASNSRASESCFG